MNKSNKAKKRKAKIRRNTGIPRQVANQVQNLSGEMRRLKKQVLDVRGTASIAARKDIKKLRDITRNLDQPFAGHDDSAVFWLRRYLNPCDDTKLSDLGIPDMECAPAAKYGIMYSVSYNAADTFADATFYTRIKLTGADEFTWYKVLVHRSSYKATRMYLFPNYFAPLLVVEEGSYSVTLYSHNGSTIKTWTTNYVAKWYPGNNNANYIISTANGYEQRLPKTSPLFRQGIQYYRNNFFGMTLKNLGKPLDKNGGLFARYFNLDTEVSTTKTEWNTVSQYDRPTLNIYGVPITETDFCAKDNDGVVLDARGGLYGVLYNWHPDFKYQKMEDVYLTNAFDENADPNVISGINLVNRVCPHDGVDISLIEEEGQNISIDAAQVTYSDADLWMNCVYLWDNTNAGDQSSEAHDLTVFPIPKFWNDSWSWKGLAVYYNGTADGLVATIKICAEYSAMISPISPLISNVVRPPAYDPELVQFAVTFMHSKTMLFPESYNSWNKIWSAVKKFYAKNQKWIKPALKTALDTLL